MDFNSLTLSPIFEKSLIKNEGWLIIEHQAKRKLQSGIQPDEIRKYGNCAFSIFKTSSQFTVDGSQ